MTYTLVYLNAIKDYIIAGGKSRGSYIIGDENGKKPLECLSEVFKFSIEKGNDDKILEVKCSKKVEKLIVDTSLTDVRPIPMVDNWFENVWNDYMDDKIIK